MRRWNTLAKIILDYDIKTFVEVGTAQGKNISHIFDIIKDYDIKIWCVDPYKPYKGYNNDANAVPDRIRSNKEKAMSTIFQDGRVTHIDKFSVETSKEFEDESLDLVFIDANHDYEYVMQDLNVWYPKVKSGMFFAGHDYTWEKRNKEGSGIITAVDEFLEENKLEMWYHDKARTFVIRKP